MESNKSKKNATVTRESSDTSHEAEFIASGSSSGGDEFLNPSENEDEKIVIDDKFLPLSRDPKVNEFVLVLFPLTKQKIFVYYVAKILQVDGNDSDFFVSFLRINSRARQTFCEPNVPDIAGIRVRDIKLLAVPECKRLFHLRFISICCC